ncbi:MAG: T9SS type A sorting domain-containing protein [Bacteroidota bacterium]
MKYLTILLVVILPVFIYGQDFQFVCSPGTTYYKSPVNSLKAFRRDSVVTSGVNDTTFYSYRTILNVDGNPCKDTIGGSVLGRKIFKRHDGWFHFFNRANDTIFLNSQGVVGTTWKFCNLPNSCYLQAEIISIGMDSVLGIPDEVKIISLQAKNNIHVNIPHIFNQKQIKLSKHYGFSQMFDVYLMPNDTTIFKLCGKTDLSLGFQNLKWQEIFNYDPGDIFHYRGSFTGYGNGGGWSEIYKVLSKTTYGNNDSVEYIMEYCKREVVGGYPPTVYNTWDTITVRYNWEQLDLNNQWALRLPEEFVPSAGFADLYYQNVNVFNGREMKGRIRNRYSFSNSANCWAWFGGGGTPYYTYNYTKGLGNTSYSYFVIPELNPVYSDENLVYFQKGTETWGTPVSTACNILLPVDENTVKSNMKVHIIPNPVVSSSTITIENFDISTHPVLQIIDIYGRSVFLCGVQCNQTVFNRNDIPAGLYILRIMDHDGIGCSSRMVIIN